MDMKVNTMIVFKHCNLRTDNASKDCETIHFYQSKRIDFWQLLHCTQSYLQLPGWPFSEPLALHCNPGQTKKGFEAEVAIMRRMIKQQSNKELDTQ